MRGQNKIIFFILVLLILLPGCQLQKKVSIDRNRYIPEFSVPDPAYKGKMLNLLSLVDKANDISLGYYYSSDKEIIYENQYGSIMSYLWYCFRDGLRHAGLGVLEDAKPDGNIPDLRITINSITDRHFEFQIRLAKGGVTLLEKKMAVESGPAADNSNTALERNAYAVMDKAVQAILEDGEFKKAFLSK